MNNITRDSFTSRFGIIAAAAGSAIGLGNIWKFPYITGKYGGAAFIILYLICIFLIGFPVMLSEFIIGRRTQKNAIGAFKSLSPDKPWYLTGWAGVAAAFFILSFYSVVGGWTIDYVIRSLTGNFINKTPTEIVNTFESFISNPVMPVIWQIIFMILTCLIVLGGIKNGIEKYSKIMMPILFILIIILDIRALTLDNSIQGISFIFRPDWSLLTPEAVLVALGHAFFSLSLGMGTMTTYASYINKKENLTQTAFRVTILDTVIALLAGIAIFPAVFAFEIEPTSGPGLVFVTLPGIFQMLPLGMFFSTLFFVLLAVAALTSAISLLEVPVAFFVEEKGMERRVAATLTTLIITIIGIFASLSQGILSNVKIFNLNIFNFLEFTSSNILLPSGGLLITLFVGWYLNRRDVEEELSNNGRIRISSLSFFLLAVKIVSPALIIIVFLNGLGIIR